MPTAADETGVDEAGTDANLGQHRCPGCGGSGCRSFYSVTNIPTNSCMLIPDREAAFNVPTGDLELRFCPSCGFIFNGLWRHDATVYAKGYEETQAYSPTFNNFQRSIAEMLVERYGLRGKRILEIGCGKGEFLAMICEMGGNFGLGFDPGFVPGRFGEISNGHVEIIADYFDKNTKVDPGDLICCKMTLEHISEVGEFIRNIRTLIGQRETAVFFQIPDASRILDALAFYDIYYEHCSYFTPQSLASVFISAGFAVDDIWTGYGDQYLMICAHPVETTPASNPELSPPSALAAQVERFAADVDVLLDHWRDRLRGYKAEGRKVILWGSGSKAVSFLTTLGITDEVAFVADINPHRHGCYLPRSGHLIVSPQTVAIEAPNVVIVMNPLYVEEVRTDLAALGCRPTLLTL
jgi:SAM-dependent methyltransferase